MSYARLGADGSDVYVYLHYKGWLECCWCSLIPGPSLERYKAHTTAEMVEHLEEHRSRGHTVSASTFEQLREDQSENDEWLATI